jgi:AAA domain
MPLIYITGLSGTGKSAVVHELQRRGYEAHGMDEHGFAYWVHRRTHKIQQLPQGHSSFDIHNWYTEHEWVLDAGKVKQLKEHSDVSNKTVFLCGVASGEAKAWKYFDQAFALVVDSDTLRQRIASRTTNDFGKSSAELAEIMRWHGTYKNTYRKFGANIINAAQPLTAVVDEILAKLKIGQKWPGT